MLCISPLECALLDSALVWLGLVCFALLRSARSARFGWQPVSKLQLAAGASLLESAVS